MASCKTCERKPNRVDGQCPVYNMDDGRHFTDYRPRCVQNNNAAGNSGVMNSYEYRMYLQHNGEKIIKQNQNVANENNKCVPCYDLNEEGTMLPEVNKFQCDANTCSLNNNQSHGIGTGRNHKVPRRGGEDKVVTKEAFLNF